jgi:hypothetical protein
MSHETALIIIDSGFSQQAIDRARRVIAINDLPSGRVVIGNPTVSAEDLAEFAGDSLHHGTIVLERLMDRVPDMPVILVRALGERGSSFMRTSWNDDGTIAEQGWTEGYRWAVDLCRKLGMRSVANCSFGAFIHASDGTGWEAHQVSKETGPGKPNHIMVVAAGPGDGRAQHASWRQLPGETIPVSVQQREDAKYNLWSASEKGALWQLTVYLNGEEQFTIDSRNVPRNLWNQRKQQTFTVRGEGRVDLVMHVDSTGTTDDGVNEGALRFDVWAPSDMSACFLSRIDLTLISEPAIFSEVIAVGLRRGVYAENQTQEGVKPEVLLPGGEQISFRIPEVVAEIARMLRDSAEDLDVVAVRNRLGKYPKLNS